MKNNAKHGENLIFLISQPRAGSTLLQHILGNHSAIYTMPEPWLMLHPLYALRSEGYEAEYDASLAWRARLNFIQTLPAGEDEYFEGVRRMLAYLYQSALEHSGKRYFLDKTPRYYFIIPELFRTFPKARYIILLRNPVAILNSFLNNWTLFLLYLYKHDLLRAPHLLLEGIEMLGEQCVVVRYEQLVADPDDEIRKICQWIGVNFTPEMVQYSHHGLRQGHFGDKEGIARHTQPVSQNAEKWMHALGDPQRWRLANDYLQLLGQKTIDQMGYSYKQLQETLDARRPHYLRLWRTFSLSQLLRKPVQANNVWRRTLARLIRSIQKRGLRGTVMVGMQMFSERHSTLNLPSAPPGKSD